jgi:hypothetical protein
VALGRRGIIGLAKALIGFVGFLGTFFDMKFVIVVGC